MDRKREKTQVRDDRGKKTTITTKVTMITIITIIGYCNNGTNCRVYNANLK